MKNLISLICPELKNTYITANGSYTKSWIIADEVAENLKYVAFHNKQNQKSFMAGFITKIEPCPTFPNKKIIHFKPTSKFSIPGGKLNWGQEKAYGKMKNIS